MTFRKWYENWRKLLSDKGYLFQLFLSLVFMVAAYFVYAMAIDYIDTLTRVPSVGDLLLDWLPSADLRILYVFGVPVVLLFLFFFILIKRPDLMPFTVKLFMAVFLVRSVFICLTHMGPPAGFMIPVFAEDYSFWPFRHMMHTNDLFFSGHVSYPFMAALVVKQYRNLFYFFLAVSILMALTVLIMRIHYSIDVFAAFFIVYGIYAIICRLFGKTDFSFHKIITR